MLRKHTQLFEVLFTASDLLVVSVAWVLSYYIRFSSGLMPVEKGVAPFSDYFRMLIFVGLIWAFVFNRAGLYRPMRGASRLREILAVVRANSLSVLLLLAATYLFREKSIPFSRAVFVIFWINSTLFLVISRSAIRTLLRAMRKRGFNLRHVLIVGSGDLAISVAKSMSLHPEYGINCVGCLAPDEDRINAPKLRQVVGAGATATQLSITGGMSNPKVEVSPNIVGIYSDLPLFLAKGSIDSVIIALPLSEHSKLEYVVNLIQDEMVDVRIVPDFHQFIRLGSFIEEFDGLPVVSMASTPLSGMNTAIKRVFDIVFGALFFVLSFPIMLITAVLVKLTSRGPIFFKQERVGLDGKTFEILKFRTMKVDAEKDGAKFAVKGDDRVTPIGGFLRSWNIDEIPQLLNVLKGQMSLVGPRPERPVFIREFRQHFSKYMLRHKVQAGMTGWAQVHGWRGNTSIQKRIEHDLFYIENWSVLLDIKIIILTFLKSFTDKNAY